MKAAVARTPMLVSLLTLSLLGVSSFARAQQQPFMPTVPIRIPAGTRGMQPNLALVYSPSGGNGLLGVGWTLSGIPAISRVNYGHGINFGADQGLESFPDTYAHSEVGVLVAQSNGTYRSKKESFMRFQPSGTCGAGPSVLSPGPCSWTVTDRSGTQYFFGDTSDSRLMVVPDSAGVTGVKIWALSRVQDLFGNSWSVTYNQDAQDVSNGQLTPNVITYTQGPGLRTYRTVEFSYDTTRTDTDHGYYSSRGYVQAQTRRLTGIQIKSAGVLLRQYVLSYDYGTTSGVQGRSRLMSIQEKDGAGNSLPAQVFTYEQGLPGLTAAPWGNSGSPATSIGQDALILTGDFDADGKTDFAYVYQTSAGKIGFRVQRSSAPSGSTEWAPLDAGPWYSPLTKRGTFLTGDFDGDGRTDIAFVHWIDADRTDCDFAANDPYCGDRGAIDVYRSTGYAFVKWPSFTGLTSDPEPVVFPGGSNWPLWGAWMTGDFNGDGKTDIAFFGVRSTHMPGWIHPSVRVYYGGPSSLAEGLLLFPIPGALPYYKCEATPENCWDLNWQQHATVLTGDFDGDSLTDIMVISDGGPPQFGHGPSTMQFREIRPAPDSTTVNRVWQSPDFAAWKCGTSWRQCGTFLSVDFNGDGKTDVAYLSQNVPDSTDVLATKVATDIFFSTGNGLAHWWQISPQEIWHGGRSWQDIGTFLKGDFDGDGKADLAYAWNNAGQIQIDVALGSQSGRNFGDWARWFAPGSIPWFTGTGGASWQTVAAFQTGIFDGWGKMDISYAYLNSNSNAWSYVNLSNYLDHPLPPDLMTDVDNGSGGTQHVEYVSAPHFPNAITPGFVTAPNVPNTSPQLLVTSVRVSDGRGGDSTTKYGYESAQILPGTIDQQRNMGFHTIIATDAQTGQSIETQYRQDVAGLEGQPAYVLVRNGAGQYMRQLRSSYQIVNPAAQSGTCTDVTYNCGTELVETTDGVDAVFEQASSLSSPAYVRSMSYSYDAAGNIASQRNIATGLPTIDITTNYNPDFTNWILDQLKDRSVYSDGVQLQSTVYTWTNNNVTAIANWLDTENRSIVSSMSYDANGRLTSMTEPSTTDGLLRETTITAYDDTFHAYPKVITDAKGFTTQRSYTAEGELAAFIDENNEVTVYQYDGFGRKTKEIRADSGTTVYNYNLTSNPYTQYTEIVTQVDTSNTIREKSYFDGTGFVYRSERTGDTGPICVFRQKDNAGRVAAVSNPTFNCSHGGDVFTNIAYEAAGRPYTIKTPDDYFTRYTYEANNSHFPCPNGRLEHVFDANSRDTTRCIDSRERTVSVTDPLGRVTTYGYDPLGRVTSVSLPGGMSSTIHFDSLGRKTSLNDSQIGVTNYTYYDNGNLKSTTTGDAALTSSKTVTYSYDALNRATTKTVSDSQAGSEGPITFAYDESGHTDAIGRLTTVTGNNGLTTQYSYTHLGQPNVLSRRIVNSWTGTTDNFTEAYTYDLGGRLTSLQYPDGSIAKYFYTVGGNLHRVDLNGVTRATWSNYDAFGAAGNIQYQNGVNTAYTFDVMHHLTGLVTTKSDVLTQTVFQNLTFDWYATQTATNGLVLGKIEDNRQSTVIDGVDTSEMQTYWYDTLYRLASASGVWGTRTYLYDANNSGVGIGNPTSFGGVTQRTLSFSGTKLTAAKDSAGWSISGIGYDTSGNMTKKIVTSAGTTTTWQYKWTGENRLATATYTQARGGVTTTMLYDEAGQRFMKHRHIDYGSATPDETTTHIGKAYEKWTSAGPTTGPDKHTLHLFGNGQLIMSWTRQGSVQTAFNNENGWRSDIAAASMYDVGTFKGACHKLWHLARAAARHPSAKPYTALAMLSLLLALGFSLLLRRPTRYSRCQRFVAASLLLALGLSAGSGLEPHTGEATRDVLRGTAPGVGTFFYHRNHINSSAVITDINGAEVSRMVYMPFGELSQNNSHGSDVVTDKYTGQVSDPETGLYYYNARYYDPMIGRFLSADPIMGNPLNAQSYNRYAYTRNNPITNTDPSGLCPPSDPTILCYGTPSSADGWIGSLIGAAGWLFGFSWLGGSHNSGPSGPKPWTAPQVPVGTPSTPLQVDQSSSGNPNGTLARAQAINELAALKVRMASQRITPEAIEYKLARGTVGLLGGLDSGWGTYIADHPVKSGAMIFGGVFVIGVSGGVGYGLLTGTLEVSTITLTVGGGLSPFAKPAFERGVEISERFGENLPSNFPTIDRVVGLAENGIADEAISIKSMDLLAKSYQTSGAVFSRVAGYIDSLSRFTGRSWGGVNVVVGPDTSKALNLVIQAGASSPGQWYELLQASRYATSLGIDLNIFSIP